MKKDKTKECVCVCVYFTWWSGLSNLTIDRKGEIYYIRPAGHSPNNVSKLLINKEKLLNILRVERVIRRPDFVEECSRNVYKAGDGKIRFVVKDDEGQFDDGLNDGSWKINDAHLEDNKW